MDISTLFLILIAVGLLYLLVRQPEPTWWTWHKNGRRLDFRGNGSTGMVMYFDGDKSFHWHTYHVADPDSMIKAFKWLNGEEVEL